MSTTPRELNYRWGVGLAQRALGLIDQARGNLAEAERFAAEVGTVPPK
jgi:hypothetical protein